MCLHCQIVLIDNLADLTARCCHGKMQLDEDYNGVCDSDEVEDRQSSEGVEVEGEESVENAMD